MLGWRFVARSIILLFLRSHMRSAANPSSSSSQLQSWIPPISSSSHSHPADPTIVLFSSLITTTAS
ncbi:hypothetical protein KFK09_028554 [Dendrobium nobile]|uniref:Secreted protein n=1 Tax=Dendrobium nobile TaxID=94219 RepID=A0A8T3A1W2_DENNO|nr:hypothetical protein KFK09_028554 [Dendrobium nobile]